MLYRGSLFAAAVALGCAACARSVPVDSAANLISASDLAAKIQAVSADSMEGRAPASVGEERTIAYLRDQFRAIGLEPGNGDSYYQEVPLVSITADPSMQLSVAGKGATHRYRYGSQFMGWTKRVTRRVDVAASPMVFVGYGIVAPEYRWNDYAGLDVRGKAVVILVNDPGFATQDTALFTGNAMTYYGRWTYKYEEAARQGAAAAIIVHETAPAGYPWEVVSGSWSGPQFDLVPPDSNMHRVKVEGWVTHDVAREIFRQAGLSYDSLKVPAATRGFKAVPMGLTASVGIGNTLARSTSHNVLALRRGTTRPDEIVVYTAHWDHLGRDTTLAGDQIYNGALDNGSGTAGLLELAQAFAALDPAPARSVLFLSVTAEEQGLLGSKYYAANPVYPLNHTVADINMDILNWYGPTHDITVVGLGNSELDDYLRAEAEKQGRVLRPNPEPEKGFYFRSDHFELAKRGVPALYTESGIESIAHDSAWGREQRDIYTNEHYHKPSDEYDASWDLSGAVQDLRLLFRVGYRLANDTVFPKWSPTSPFKALRDSMMK